MGAPLKALLVAAGIGSRLRPLTNVLPKCLMPVNGRPLLGLWLDMLRDAGAADTVVNLHHHAELVRRYVERSPHAGAVILAHEETLLGTAGTLMRHRERLGEASPILFAHADNLSAFSMARFLAAHEARPPGALITMMTFVTETPELCGIVQLDVQGRIAEFHEKPAQPKGNVANAAVYLLDPALFAVLDGFGPVQDFSTEVLPRLLDRVHTFHNDIYHRDIGTLASLSRAQLDYFCAGDTAASGPGDPWYGMMSEDGGRLAHDFARAVEAAFSAQARRT